MRHPIIERIIDYEYIPHDITLDDKITGNLIYGPNSAGKSSLMKAIGVNIIMAQCGLYVAAEYFEYNIFTSLYTRISGNDNLFKSQSSFVVEMTELKNIIKKANNKTLIIGDEICRGTENTSGNAIVAATILKLSKLNAKFIFATHLHDIVKIPKIKQLTNIKSFYLSVDIDTNGDLVFSRNLIEGSGEEIYGITIAKSILDDIELINEATNIKNDLTNNKNLIVNPKKSLYNNDMFISHCSICKSKDKLETHHINFQKDFKNTKNGIVNKDKLHILKDDTSNLVVLCSSCHDKLHNKEFVIEKKIQTSAGVKVLLHP